MNVYAPYLPLDEARAIVRDAIGTWNDSSHERLSIAEGWALSNLFLNDLRQLDHLTDAGIVRLDEPGEYEGCLRTEPFEGDEAVVELLQTRVAAGEDPTGTYALALHVEHALNSMRFHLWGEEFVDSRCGPDPDDLRHGATFDHDRAMDGLDQLAEVAR